MQNFFGTGFGNKAKGFDKPTQLPRDERQRLDWQIANKTWWEATPMRYDWREEISAPEGTKEYFERIDRRFLSSARKYMPWQRIPFEAVIPFAELREKDVLEIGVGQGTHAQLLASHCRSFTGIDLTDYAVDMTLKRFKLFNLPGEIRQMDAERMEFDDGSFDYIWSWGVIHHSADTRRVLEEMHRVLRRGGTCAVMVYYRSWWHYYVCGVLRAFYQKQLLKQRNLHLVAQVATDGAIARYYSRTDWRIIVNGLFEMEAIRIYGLKNELVPLPHSRTKAVLENLIPDGLARLLINGLSMGSFIFADMRKI